MNTNKDEIVLASVPLSIRKPRRHEILILRFLIFGGILSMLQFLWWYFDHNFIGHTILYATLTVSLGYKLLHLLYEWYYLGAIGKKSQWREPKRDWRVDMLTTFVPGEPYSVVEKTLRAMVQVRYPHTTFLCDEGDDPYLKNLCAELGIVHVYRGKDKTGAKAGNINYALRHHATGDICVILDPDHAPEPEFLDRTLPYFDDPSVGYVQCIQGYSNAGESLVAKGAAEQTYLFYGPMMMGMHRYGTVQAIGANCTFRRAALDSIGGHAIGLCEDMHTSMLLHAKKWTSVYVPELLTRGLVPASLSAFYKQQLKWSRGSFELLFEEYPKHFKNFNWRQRLHYLLTPLYFLSGFIVLIDISVPIISLFTSEVPLFINFKAFLLRAIPVLLSATVIRHYAQHFLLEQHERGFHTIGSILRTGTWWVYLLGMVYAILRIKVPYIPTPKENEATNEWKICTPNLFVIALSLVAVGYGLHRDWTPYAWLMAGFVGANGILLALAVLIGQQAWIARLFKSKFSVWRHYWFLIRHRVLYRFIQHDGVVIVCTFLALTLSASHIVRFGVPATLSAVDEILDTKSIPWLLTTDDSTQLRVAIGQDNRWQHKQLAAFDMAATYADSMLPVATRVFSYCRQTNQLPLLRWPSVVSSKDDSTVIRSIAELMTSYQHPILLSCGMIDSSRLSACRTLKAAFERAGASNVAWVGELRVGDSVQLRSFSRHEWLDISLVHLEANFQFDLDTLFRRLPQNCPVLLGSNNPQKKDFFSGLITQHRKADKPLLGWVEESKFMKTADLPDAVGEMSNIDYHVSDKVSHNKSGGRGIHFDSVSQRFQWVVGGMPFYVKGVVYNPEHDWRDGRWPPTRRQLASDFSRIKAMGANTIIREGPSVYDRNILNIAEEHGLKVIFGFWCDPSIDYLAETEQKRHLKNKILRLVKARRDHPALLAWVVSNGTWGALANHFHQPYLTHARLAYVEWLEDLVRDIKDVDPSRLVVKSLDDEKGFFGALDDLRWAATSVDVVAFSVSTLQQLETFDDALRTWNGGMPYLVSGFGGKSLWDTLVGGVGQNEVLPDKSSFEKARRYAQLWEYIKRNSANNLGGAAYCWRDRMEGTTIMSGICDYKGRLKPAYFSLKQLWTGERQSFPLADLWLKCDIYFENNENYFIFSAMTPNNTQPNLRYEWYICREEYLERLEEVTINYEKMGAIRFYLLSNFYEHIYKDFSPQQHGTKIKFLNKQNARLQRIYLHISDEQGHVVTASYPIHPERLIQRYKPSDL